MWLVTGHGEPVPNYECRKHAPLAAIVGDGPSQTSIPIARLLGIYRYPQISFASSVISLSDKLEFPSFFRNIPSDDFQAVGLARLVMHFGWIWVGLLAEDNDYGQGIHIVKEEIVKAGGEGPFINRTCANIMDFEPWQLLHYFKNVHFTTTDGMEMFFDKNGDPAPVYDILNWHVSPNKTIEIMKVGILDFSAPKGQEFIINESAIMWNGGQTQIPRSVCTESCLPGYRKATQPGQPVCCFDCIPCSTGEISNQTDATECLKCPNDHWSNERQDTCILKNIEFLSFEEPLGATLIAISISCASISAIVLCIFIKYRDTPIVKANNREISYLLLLALGLSFLCSLIFIGEPRAVTCMLRQAAFGIVFALCVSCVLAKTILVVVAFNATKPNNNLKK
nr:PREDICTED: extracellular calcium-sensing receptor-like [Latimeria chalumnae]|eukprot:XP_014350173.1 PREDICTED: extracellular calcium-sensing receptor-like [Latimeria chalumnae]